jgi:hypothetical protein
MIPRLSLPVALISAVGMITLASFAPWGATKAVADPGGDRLGCSTYCQNAGGYGAPGTTAPPAVTVVSSGTAAADPDGYVPVTLRCNLSVQCSGALLLCVEDSAAWYHDPTRLNLSPCGRSDLLVGAGATRTIGVPLPAPVLTFVRSRGPTAFSVGGDSRQSGVGTESKTLIDGDLTVAASR